MAPGTWAPADGSRYTGALLCERQRMPREVARGWGRFPKNWGRRRDRARLSPQEGQGKSAPAESRAGGALGTPLPPGPGLSLHFRAVGQHPCSWKNGSRRLAGAGPSPEPPLGCGRIWVSFPPAGCRGARVRTDLRAEGPPGSALEFPGGGGGPGGDKVRGPGSGRRARRSGRERDITGRGQRGAPGAEPSAESAAPEPSGEERAPRPRWSGTKVRRGPPAAGARFRPAPPRARDS